MRDKRVAERYALAALNHITDKKEMEKVGEDLEMFAAMYAENVELKKMCNNPAFSVQDKTKVLAKIAKVASFSAKSASILNVILKRGRIMLAADIAESYGAMLDERLGRQKVAVTSTFALSDQEVSDLEKSFSAITGKKAVVGVSLDKSLIGGVVARVGSVVYDGSVVNQLRIMKQKAEV
jgi:F-type H+-transporting ATPase subunit delta